MQTEKSPTPGRNGAFETVTTARRVGVSASMGI